MERAPLIEIASPTDAGVWAQGEPTAESERAMDDALHGSRSENPLGAPAEPEGLARGAPAPQGDAFRPPDAEDRAGSEAQIVAGAVNVPLEESAASLRHVLPDRWQQVPQFVDPAVSRVKFEREVSLFRAHQDEYRRRGWFLELAEFPAVLVLFSAPHLRPAPLLFGAMFDFSNYDLLPPSLRVVDPFTRKPYTMADLPMPPLLRRVPTPQDQAHPVNGTPGDADFGVQQPGPSGVAVVETQVVPLLQAWNPTDAPFVCVRGVREYHSNVAHSGDPWLIHRGRGEGTLLALCEILDAYGVRPLSGYHVQFRVQSMRAPGGLQQLIEYRVHALEVDPGKLPN